MAIFQGSTDDTKKILVQFLAQHPMLKSFLVGALSGTCSTLLFQPFDLVKTRIQNAHFSLISEGNAGARTTRFVPVIYEVVKNEQLFGLWRGTAPSLIRCVPGVGIHFCCLDTLQNHFCVNRKPTALEAVTFGAISRSIASVLLIPVTVIKTRYESGLYSYKNITDALRHTYQNEGIRGLRSGLLPTLMRDVPFSGLYFMFYSQLKSIVLKTGVHNTQQKQYSKSNLISTSSLTFACGLGAGLMASIVTQPMDVIKTRMQMNSKQFPTFYQTTAFILRQDKMRGLFAGLVPRMMRRTLMASMAWTVYEQMMRSLCLK